MAISIVVVIIVWSKITYHELTDLGLLMFILFATFDFEQLNLKWACVWNYARGRDGVGGG